LGLLRPCCAPGQRNKVCSRQGLIRPGIWLLRPRALRATGAFCPAPLCRTARGPENAPATPPTSPGTPPGGDRHPWGRLRAHGRGYGHPPDDVHGARPGDLVGLRPLPPRRPPPRPSPPPPPPVPARPRCRTAPPARARS